MFFSASEGVSSGGFYPAALSKGILSGDCVLGKFCLGFVNVFYLAPVVSGGKTRYRKSTTHWTITCLYQSTCTGTRRQETMQCVITISLAALRAFNIGSSSSSSSMNIRLLAYGLYCHAT